MAESENEKVLVGISSCLLGEKVRYDGCDKYSRYCAEVLGRYFDFKPFCPEVAIGMGVPRETIRLISEKGDTRAVGTVNPDFDVTQRLRQFADSVGQDLDMLRGYIFMSASPSCGLYSTKIYSREGMQIGEGAGLFSRRLHQHFPLLPMEEVICFDDPCSRENFVSRVYLYHRWMNEVAVEPTAQKLMEFHSRQKYLVMSYGQILYRETGAIVAGADRENSGTVAQRYIQALMQGTLKPPTRKGHVNALHHMAGYLRKNLPGGARQNLHTIIEEYRMCRLPLAIPMQLLRNLIDNHAGDYIKKQAYLNPYPHQLGLRDEI